MRADPFTLIEDHALIGDCHSAALVTTNATIDWLCLPRFDSPSLFASLLDPQRGGQFSIAVAGQRAATQQRYLTGTNLLSTQLEGETGRLSVTDFIAPYAGTSRVVRELRCASGELSVELRIDARPDYARARPAWHGGGRSWSARLGPARLNVFSDVPLVLADHALIGRVQVSPPEGVRRIALWLGDEGPVSFDALRAAATALWQGWAAHGVTHLGAAQEAVTRSALLLKLLTHTPTGAVIAAPTTSLPEELGGERNWDYRFTWIRDATMVLYALDRVGHFDEAAGFFHWMLGCCSRKLKVLMRVDGSTDIGEEALPHLCGYEHSRPVRVGNAAIEQRQLDLYGEVLDSAYYFHRVGGEIRPELWRLLCDLADEACEAWRLPDAGIWEVRGPLQHFTYSKVQCWVALDRAIKLAADLGTPPQIDMWRHVRAEIRSSVLRRGFNRRLGTFTQALDGALLDASALLFPSLGFIDARDDRMRSTVAAIRDRLGAGDFLYRYRGADDGVTGGEGSFLLCSFWLADVLALAGDTDQAERIYGRLLARANHVGLLPEQIDPATGRFLGNFPQGFSHLAAINSALVLAEQAGRGVHAGRTGPDAD